MQLHPHAIKSIIIRITYTYTHTHMCMRTRHAYITHTCKAHTRNHLLTCKAHIHVWQTYILTHTHTHTQPHRMQVHNTLLHNTHAHTCTQAHTFANTHIHGLQAYTRRRIHNTNIGRHAHILTQTCISFIICTLKSHTFLHSQTYTEHTYMAYIHICCIHNQAHSIQVHAMHASTHTHTHACNTQHAGTHSS